MYIDLCTYNPIFRPVIVASPDGGVDIEEVAEKTPDRIMKLPGT